MRRQTVAASWPPLLLLLLLGVCSPHLASAQDGLDVPTFERIKAVNFTNGLVYQFLGAHRQAVRIPMRLFRENPCQVVYMASPDWAGYHVQVRRALAASAPANATCQPQFAVFVDGENALDGGSKQLTLSSAGIPWAAAVHIPKYTQFTDEQAKNLGGLQVEPFSQSSSSSSSQSPSNRRRGRALAQALGDDYNFTASQQDTLTRIQFLKRYTQDSLARTLNLDSEVLPGPKSFMRKPYFNTPFKFTYKGAQWGIPPVIPPDLSPAGRKADKEAGGVYVFPDSLRSYWAPADECKRALSEAGAKKALRGVSRDAGVPLGSVLRSAPAYESCYISQLVVYVYYDCANMPALDAKTKKEAEAPAAQSNNPIEQKAAEVLDKSLGIGAFFLNEDDSQGYVDVVAGYSPYPECTDIDATELNMLAFQILIIAGGYFVVILVWLLVPTGFRMTVSYPLGAIVRLIRGKLPSQANKPLHTESRLHDYVHLPRGLMSLVNHIPGVSHILRMRKYTLYAVCTVKAAEGQSRYLQVALTSLATLSVCLVVYTPRIDGRLWVLPPILAMKASRSGDSLGFFLIMLAYSAVVGTVAYMSMLANFNDPSNEYYWLQATISVFSHTLFNVFIVFQLAALASQWGLMANPYPFLPMLVIMLFLLLVSDIFQFWVLAQSPKQKKLTKQRQASLKQASSKRGGAADDFTALHDVAAGATSGRQVAPGKGSAYSPPSSGDNAEPPRAVVIHSPSPAGPRSSTGGRTRMSDAPASPGPVAESTGFGGGDGGHSSGQLGRVSGKGSLARSSKASSSAKEEEAEKPPPSIGDIIKGLPRAVWLAVCENDHFQYPSQFVSALLVCATLLLYQYSRALVWADKIADCLEDPIDCANVNVEKFIKFADTAATKSRETQEQLLRALVAVKDANQLYDQQLAAAKQTIVDLNFANNILNGELSRTQRALADMNVTDPSPGLKTSVMGTLGRALNALETQLAFASTATDMLFMITNATAETATEVIGKTVIITDKVVGFAKSDWEDKVKLRCRATSVVGFTLGLLLGFSTLLRTMAAFKRAVKRRRLANALKTAMPTAKNEAFDATANLAAKADLVPISQSVFFFGVLLSTAVFQLYMVGVTLTVALTIIVHPWTYTVFIATYWPWMLNIILLVVISKVIFLTYVGNVYISDGDHVYRAAAWLAYSVVMATVNLIVGLLLALLRIVLLLVTTIFTLGQLETSIFAIFPFLDLPHMSFLGMLHVHKSTTKFSDPIYLPGPRGRAHRRWRRLATVVRNMKPEEFRRCALDEHELADAEDVEARPSKGAA